VDGEKKRRENLFISSGGFFRRGRVYMYLAGGAAVCVRRIRAAELAAPGGWDPRAVPAGVTGLTAL